MDRTLFTPAMIETFKVCKRAYEYAFVKPRAAGNPKLSTVVKRFLLRAFAEVNRGRITSVQEAQRYIGQQWSAIKGSETDGTSHESILAFRFAYKALTQYATRPYKPGGAEVVAVNMKMRARIPGSRVYLEDVFDLVLWHPQQQMLEVVDFHLKPIKPLDPAWPDTQVLIKHFLVAKLRTRYAFGRARYTFGHIQSQRVQLQSMELDESVFQIHWQELVKTIEEMKSPAQYPPEPSDICKRCEFSSPCLSSGCWSTKEERKDAIYRTA